MGKLAVKQVENAKAGMHSDGGGLYLQVSGPEAKSWVFRYKLDGRQRYMGLGSAIVVPLKKARELAGLAKQNTTNSLSSRRREYVSGVADRTPAAQNIISAPAILCSLALAGACGPVRASSPKHV